MLTGRLIIVLFSVFGAIPGLFALESGDVFWLFSKDRYGRDVLADPVVVPRGAEPYGHLAATQGFGDWMLKPNGGGVTILSEKPMRGVIPVLCFHKIGPTGRYTLRPERFRLLLRYINSSGWHPISDYQYLQGDLSRVPSGLKPIVLGADDAAAGVLLYETEGQSITDPVKRLFGKPLLKRDSMVAILEKHAPRENGRINFTFYISFDAIPFRQLDGYKNPGFPYASIPIVREKIRYLEKHFNLGIHTLSHVYAPEVGADIFARDVLAAWELIDEYAGGRAETVRSLAFPYGIEALTPALRHSVSSLERHGVKLAGAFNIGGRAAPPPGAMEEVFDVPRISVDNDNWDWVMSFLDRMDAVRAKREIVWESDIKRLPKSRWLLGASSSDRVWVLVRGNG